MDFRLYNSLNRQIEDFKPLNSQEIRIYSCGPTVYERAHIGNLSSYIYIDTLKRVLSVVFPDAKVKHVMNITDVDDKTIAGSTKEYPGLEPMEALKKLTTKYEKLFMDDLTAVGIDTNDITFLRATENIDQMQELIKKLLDGGIAYVADDGIYFSIEKYTKSGRKYGQLVDVTPASTSESRISNDDYDKDNAHDFVLWKIQKPGEPAWDFEIDGKNLAGRPGWHIECSAMSVSALGQPFDIHTGGVDLKFPHHENEIAQSTAVDGDLLANLFSHNEHLQVDKQKMSKSFNNFYSLDDIREKGFDPMAFRLLVLQSHYRSQGHFTWDNLQAAANRLRDLRAGGKTDANRSDLMKALREDLNTPKAMTELARVSTGELNQLFGLSLAGSKDISPKQKALIKERETARAAQDWTKSDEIRRELERHGIEIKDTPDGSVWHRN